jgi:hypothetical protein
MSRDESFAERIISLLFSALSNLAIGMGTAVSAVGLAEWHVIRVQMRGHLGTP